MGLLRKDRSVLVLDRSPRHVSRPLSCASGLFTDGFGVGWHHIEKVSSKRRAITSDAWKCHTCFWFLTITTPPFSFQYPRECVIVLRLNGIATTVEITRSVGTKGSSEPLFNSSNTNKFLGLVFLLGCLLFQSFNSASIPLSLRLSIRYR